METIGGQFPKDTDPMDALLNEAIGQILPECPQTDSCSCTFHSKKRKTLLTYRNMISMHQRSTRKSRFDHERPLNGPASQLVNRERLLAIFSNLANIDDALSAEVYNEIEKLLEESTLAAHEEMNMASLDTNEVCCYHDNINNLYEVEKHELVRDDKKYSTFKGFMDISFELTDGSDVIRPRLETVFWPYNPGTVLSTLELAKKGFLVNIKEGCLASPDGEYVANLANLDHALGLAFSFVLNSKERSSPSKKRTAVTESKQGAKKKLPAPPIASADPEGTTVSPKPAPKPTHTGKIPCSLEDALQDTPHANLWLEACIKELTSLFSENTGVFADDSVDMPNQDNTLKAGDTKWLFRRVYCKKQKEHLYQASLVTKDYGIDQDASEAELDPELMLFLLINSSGSSSEVESFSFKLSDLKTDGQCRTWVSGIPGMDALPASKLPKLLGNNGSFFTNAIIPGVPDALKITRECMTLHLYDAGYVKCKQWDNLFVKQGKRYNSFVVFTSSKVMLYCHQSLSIAESEVLTSMRIPLQNLGVLREVNGVHLTRSPSRLALNQGHYMRSVIKELYKQVCEVYSPDRALSANSTPLVDVKLFDKWMHSFAEPKNQPNAQVCYVLERGTQILSYVARWTRPDLLYPVLLLQNSSDNHPEVRLQLLRNTLEYFKNSCGFLFGINPRSFASNSESKKLCISFEARVLNRNNKDYLLFGCAFAYKRCIFSWKNDIAELSTDKSPEKSIFLAFEKHLSSAVNYRKLAIGLGEEPPIFVHTPNHGMENEFDRAGWTVTRRQGVADIMDKENMVSFTLDSRFGKGDVLASMLVSTAKKDALKNHTPATQIRSTSIGKW